MQEYFPAVIERGGLLLRAKRITSASGRHCELWTSYLLTYLLTYLQ